MAYITFRCPKCGKVMQAPEEKAGMRGKCSRCGTAITAPKAPAQPDIRRTPSPELAADASPDDIASLPQRMRANRLVAGRICPGCHNEIELGDLVTNCQGCGASSHDECHKAAGGCPNPRCHNHVYQAPAQQQALAPAPPLIDAGFDNNYMVQRTKACPYCGETILATATKCKVCHEMLDETLRAKAQKVSSDDEDMTWGDIAFCVLCSGIACIFSIVYIAQGKKKGWKMLALSLFMQFIGFILMVIAEEM